MTEDDARRALRERLLDELLAKEQIREVLHRYCRGADRHDTELMRSCYHDDAAENHGMFVGSAAEFVPYAGEHLATMLWTQHFLTNAVIEVVEDAAVSDAYCLGFHRMPSRQGGVTDHWVGLRFVDRFERRSGEWKIAARTVVYEWSRIDPLGREWDLDRFVRGERSRADLSYRLLEELRSGTGS
jgi:hypothetical protein